MLPANVVSTHTVFCLKSDLDARSQWCLLGLMNSLVANYLVRLNVTTHVTAALMSRLPVPKPPAESRPFDRLVSLARIARIHRRRWRQQRLRRAQRNRRGTVRRLDRAVLGRSSTRFRSLPKSLRDLCLAVHVRATENTEARSNLDQNASRRHHRQDSWCRGRSSREPRSGPCRTVISSGDGDRDDGPGPTLRARAINRSQLQRKDRSGTTVPTSSWRTRWSSNSKPCVASNPCLQRRC